MKSIKTHSVNSTTYFLKCHANDGNDKVQKHNKEWNLVQVTVVKPLSKANWEQCLTLHSLTQVLDKAPNML